MAFDDWKIIMQWVYSVAAREVFKSFGTWRQVPIFSYFNQIRCFQSIFCRSTISYQQIHRPVGRCFSLLDLRQVFHLNEDEDVDNYIDDVDLSFVQVFLWILGRPWFSVPPWCLVLNLQNYYHQHHDRLFSIDTFPTKCAEFRHVLIFLASYTAVVLFAYFDVKQHRPWLVPDLTWKSI